MSVTIYAINTGLVRIKSFQSVSKSKVTMAKIRQLATLIPLIYLPSHDEWSADRLYQDLIVYQEKDKEMTTA